MNNYYAEYTISIQELIEKEGRNIFDFPYEIENVDKEYLQQRFIEKYYFREIGYETYSMWKYKFESYWKKTCRLYDTIFKVYKDINPMVDFRRTETIVQNELNKYLEKIDGSLDSTGKTVNKTKEKNTPISEYSPDEFYSYISESDNDSEGKQTSIANTDKDDNKKLDRQVTVEQLNESELNALNNYVKGLIDIYERFMNEFKDLFMRIF